MHRLDLTLLQHFDPPGVFTRIDPDVANALSPLPEVTERVEGCVHFCHNVGTDFSDRQAPKADEVASRRKYLRAALSEYGSMEDAARLDFGALGKGEPPKMRALQDPRIHVVRLLRHANVHLSASPLSYSHRDAVWPGPDGDHEFKYLLILATDLAQSIKATNEAKNYDAAELDFMIAWLEVEQAEWGISHVVLRTAELYGEYLAAAL